jgi:hypothetical protein
MTRYRSRSVQVEAWQWNPGDLQAAGFLVGILVGNGVEFGHPSGEGDTTTLAIATANGIEMPAYPGDWIVRGVDGNFWAVPRAVFDQTYEPVPS